MILVAYYAYCSHTADGSKILHQLRYGLISHYLIPFPGRISEPSTTVAAVLPRPALCHQTPGALASPPWGRRPAVGKPPPRPPRYGVARLGGGPGALAAGMCLIAEVPGRISFSELSISHEIFWEFLCFGWKFGVGVGMKFWWGNGRIWRIAGCQCRRSMSQSSTETCWHLELKVNSHAHCPVLPGGVW